MLEELRYESVRELFLVQYNKRVAAVGPSYQVGVTIVVEETATCVSIRSLTKVEGLHYLLSF